MEEAIWSLCLPLTWLLPSILKLLLLPLCFNPVTGGSRTQSGLQSASHLEEVAIPEQQILHHLQ